jgi:hypothetical protein
MELQITKGGVTGDVMQKMWQRNSGWTGIV